MDVREQYLAEPYQTAAQQREASFLGMWLFLATEIMMFGVLFLVITYYRLQHPTAVGEAVQHLHAVLAGFNSVLLLTGSLCMSLMVQASRLGHYRRVQQLLLLTAFFGLSFLGVKAFEYGWEYREGLLSGAGEASPLRSEAARLFMNIYFFSTALHAVHVSVAVLIVLGMVLRIHFTHMKLPQRAITLEMVGLYWHLVDMVWIFLYPSLYLVGRAI
ncbi:cytochrome c oxidase polypeptide III [Stutzerimonas stutzeri]|nr:cytochrome c oxidase polypeptide III [Stutzerimonas stutzeri]